MRTRDELVRRVEGPGIDIARLQADDRRAADGGQRVREHPSLVIDGDRDHALPPETHHPERLEKRRVGFRSKYHPDGGRSKQAIGFNIPAGVAQYTVAGSG
jgi:hypothetical protein